MKPTEKQIEYAKYLAQRMGVHLSKEFTKQAYSEFISKMREVKEEQEPIFDKPHIKGDYYDGFKNGLRTAEWRNNKMRAEIERHRRKTASIDPYDLVGDCLDIIDKYKTEGSDKE